MAVAKPADQPGQAVELARQTRLLVEQYKPQFTAVVPKHISPEAFVELAVAYVKADRWLQEAVKANPQSLILTLRQCAALGHLPMKGTYSLVPFRDKDNGWTVSGVEEWRGTVERMFRGGGVTSVHVDVARENDRVSWKPTRMVLPEHDYDEFASQGERGPLKAVYAYARLLGGGLSQVAFLNRHQVARHRAMSATVKSGKGNNFWGPEWPAEGPNTEAMWRKTALHALEGLVPTSAEYRWQLAASEAGSQNWAGIPDRPVTTAYAEPDVVDAQLVDSEWPDVVQPAATS